MLSYLLVSLLLFQPPAGKSGVTVGGKYTQSEIARAKEILAANAPKELKLNIGEFEVVEPGKNTKTPLQFQYLSNKTYFLWRIKAGQSFGLAGIRRGDKERQMYFFDAKPYEWAIIEARAEGNEVIVVNRNGVNRDVDPPEEIDRVNVIVGNPKPPTPPGPNPPDPNPPGPVPIVEKGFRVLFVVESKDLSNLPSAQLAALTSREVLDYLNANTVKAGNQPEWRRYDPDTDVSRESKIWQNAMKRPRQSLPWILVSNGSDGYEGPLPANKDELLKLLKQYGGK